MQDGDAAGGCAGVLNYIQLHQNFSKHPQVMCIYGTKLEILAAKSHVQFHIWVTYLRMSEVSMLKQMFEHAVSVLVYILYTWLGGNDTGRACMQTYI